MTDAYWFCRLGSQGGIARHRPHGHRTARGTQVDAAHIARRAVLVCAASWVLPVWIFSRRAAPLCARLDVRFRTRRACWASTLSCRCALRQRTRAIPHLLFSFCAGRGPAAPASPTTYRQHALPYGIPLLTHRYGLNLPTIHSFHGSSGCLAVLTTLKRMSAYWEFGSRHACLVHASICWNVTQHHSHRIPPVLVVLHTYLCMEKRRRRSPSLLLPLCLLDMGCVRALLSATAGVGNSVHYLGTPLRCAPHWRCMVL